MAESDSELTPEKRLLQLIEGGREQPSSPSTTVQKRSFAEKMRDMLSPEGLKAFALDLKDNWSDILNNRKDFVNLRGLNTITRLVTVLLGVYLVINLLYESQVVNKNFIESLQVPQKEGSDIVLSEKKVFDTNLLKQKERMEVFVPHSRREQKEEEKKENETSLKLVNMIKDWKLAGISLEPQNASRTFCMIEDLQKNTTTFLKEGDTISGLRVEKINPDSVTLRFNQETIELR